MDGSPESRPACPPAVFHPARRISERMRRALSFPAVLRAGPGVFGEIQRSHGHSSKIDVVIRAPT
jgi:hypothetical protein